MKRFIILLSILAMALSFSACTGKTVSPEPVSPPEQSSPAGDVSQSPGLRLSDIIPGLDSAASVAVKVPGVVPEHLSDGNTALSVYAPASEAQAREILDYLLPMSSAKAQEVEEYDSESFRFASSAVLVESAAGSYTFAVIASETDSSAVYVALTPSQSLSDIMNGAEILPLRYYEVRCGEFPIREYNAALTGVITDTEDLNNVAIAQYPGSDRAEKALNKSITAALRYMFDATIRIDGSGESPVEPGYDVKLIIGDTVYCLNTSTGDFSRESGGETVYGKLSGETLDWYMSKYSLYLN